MFEKIVLKNGMRLILVRADNIETATVLLLVGTGSKYENKKNNGISHFLEHLLGKGTKKRPTVKEISETIDSIGGIFNFFTSKEITGFWVKLQSKFLEIALDWISDIYLNSILRKEDIEKEKNVIIEEINHYLDTPIEYVGDLFERLLYKGQPAGFSILGEKENIKKFKKEDFIKYQKDHYCAKNTLLCIAGRIEDKKIEKKVERYFKGINLFSPKEKKKVFERQKKPNLLLFPKDTDQTHLCLGVRTYSLSSPKKFVVSLISTILGGPMSSRLFSEIRTKRGLAYYIETSSQFYTDSGYLVTQTGVSHQNVEKVIKLILKEYKKMKEKKVPKKELEKMKENLKGRISISLESSHDRAFFFGEQEILLGSILTPKEIFKEIDKVSSDDIQKISKEIFKPEKLNLALIGPFKNKEKLKRILNL